MKKLWAAAAALSLTMPYLATAAPAYGLPTVPEAVTPGRITGLVWHDDNMNGLRERGEALPAGTTVRLAQWQGTYYGYLTSVETDASGRYTFNNVTPGRYRLTVAGNYSVPANVGTNDTIDSDMPNLEAAVTLASGQTLTVDAGFGEWDDKVAATGALGDHTGDKLAEIFVVEPTGNLLMYTTKTEGPAQLTVDLDRDWLRKSYVAQVRDVTGDGRSDLLVRDSTDQSLTLFEGNQHVDTLYSGNQMGRNWGSVDQIVPVGNLAGGATQYVVARRASDGALYRYTLTPDGLTADTRIGTRWSGMQNITSVGDFTGDGRSDVLAVRSDGTLWAYAGTAKGTIGEGRKVGAGWAGFVSAFSPGDVSGDGRQDLVGWRADGNVYAYANLGGRWGNARLIMTGMANARVMG